jgi:hypothetical protein
MPNGDARKVVGGKVEAKACKVTLVLRVLLFVQNLNFGRNFFFQGIQIPAGRSKITQDPDNGVHL